MVIKGGKNAIPGMQRSLKHSREATDLEGCRTSMIESPMLSAGVHLKKKERDQDGITLHLKHCVLFPFEQLYASIPHFCGCESFTLCSISHLAQTLSCRRFHRSQVPIEVDNIAFGGGAYDI